jgi:hypothetical protein
VGGGVGWLDGEMGVLGMGASTARRGRRIFSMRRQGLVAVVTIASHVQPSSQTSTGGRHVKSTTKSNAPVAVTMSARFCVPKS